MLKKTHELVLKVNKFTPKSKEELNNFRIKYLGKNGLLNGLFTSFKKVPNEQKKNSSGKLLFLLLKKHPKIRC